MHELLVQLVRYARGAWRFRWWMLTVSWTICLAGWLVVSQLPDAYTSSARVFVDTQSVLKPILSGLAIQTTNSQRQVTLMTKTLLSRPNLEKVMRMTDLDLQAKTPEQQEAILDELGQNIKLVGTNKENLYTIQYKNESPEMAKLVVKSLLTIFMESNLGEVRKEQDNAQQFLEQQIQEYERRLVEAEENLKRFKQRNLGYLPGEGGGYYERLGQVKSQLASAELELKVEQDRLDVVRKQLEGETPSFGMMPNALQGGSGGPDTSELDRRISAMETRLDDMLLRYTDKHPDVMTLRSTIASLKKERKQVIAAYKPDESAPAQELNMNPVYQQMRVALSQGEANVAAKTAIVEEYRKRSEDLEAAVDRVLKVEAEQAQLNRDYTVLKRNHDELLARLESTRLSKSADSSSDSVRFRVIDPPRVPLHPTDPNRVLLSSMVLVAGLGVGLALAFLLSQFRPTFDDRQDLQEETGLTVLGSVDMVWTSGQIAARRRRNYTFLAAVSALVVVYAGVLVWYLVGVDLATVTSAVKDVV